MSESKFVKALFFINPIQSIMLCSGFYTPSTQTAPVHSEPMQCSSWVVGASVIGALLVTVMGATSR